MYVCIYCSRVHICTNETRLTYRHALASAFFPAISVAPQKHPTKADLSVGMFVRSTLYLVPSVILGLPKPSRSLVASSGLRLLVGGETQKGPLMRAHTRPRDTGRLSHKSGEVSPSRSNKYFSSGTKRVCRSRKTRSRRDSRIILASLKRHETFLLPGDIFSVFMFRDGYVRSYAST